MNSLNEILDIEHAMLMAVNAVGNADCRNSAEMFRLHRSVQFSPWSGLTLASYLDDLKKARSENRNIMTYKYARMDDLIPSENDDPLIEEITAIQIEWQFEMVNKYPELMKNARGVTSAENSSLSVSFARYLSAELESYSGRTLKLLYEDIMKYKNQGINMSEKIYEQLVLKMGFDSIEVFRAE